LRTIEREDGEAGSQAREAQRKERGLQFVADVVGPAASLVAKLKRKWSTIVFGRLPINYRLYKWVDPRFAPQWKDSLGCVYLESSSPIRVNHKWRKFLKFRKVRYTTEDWIRYIERYSDFRIVGEPLPLTPFLVHQKVKTLGPFIKERFYEHPIGEYIIAHGKRQLEDEEMLTDHWIYKDKILPKFGIYLNNEVNPAPEEE
jgi:hypothetical protein